MTSCCFWFNRCSWHRNNQPLTHKIAETQPAWKVEAVSRSTGCTKFESLPQVEMVQGDAEDRERTIGICKEADIVYCAIGFEKYQTKYWAKLWPRIVVDNLLEAASSTRFVFCDNLYA